MESEATQRSAQNPSESPPTVARLRKGDRVRRLVLLVETSNFKQTRNQKYFIQMSLRDRTAAIRAVRWEATEELYRSFTVDDFVRVDGRVEEFQQSPQLIVDAIEKVPAEGVDFGDFLPTTPKDIGELTAALREAVQSVRRPPLRALLESLLDDPEVFSALTRCPAGKSLHHAYIGGLLEHIVSLIGLGRLVASSYPTLDADLLVAAAVLHDIGKIRELSYKRNFSYTSEGQLLGHLALGIELVREKASAIADFPEKLLLEILHIIASHHGVPEYGALKVPMTREAIVFHYLDNLDAKMSTFDTVEQEIEQLGADPAPGDGGRWSDYRPFLGRKLFFPDRE